MNMTSRERVRTTLKRGVPDRVPVDYEANPGIDARLKAHFGLAEKDGEGLLRALRVDFRKLGAPYKGPRVHQDIPERGVRVSNWGIHTRYVEHESGGYWDYCDFPLQEADEATVASWPMPNPDDFDYPAVAEQCHRYDEYGLCQMCFGDLINGNGMLRGMEQTLVDLLTDEPAGLLLADRRFGIQEEVARRSLKAAGGRIDVLWLGEDLGTQRTPMISMDVFKQALQASLPEARGPGQGVRLPRHDPHLRLLELGLRRVHRYGHGRRGHAAARSRGHVPGVPQEAVR